MDTKSDLVSVPRTVLAGMAGISAPFAGRMHELLEKNTEGAISAGEKRELEVLVRVAQLDQIVTLALQLPNRS